MSGIINQSENTVLEQAEQHLETTMPPEVKANYDKIVVAGMHAALAKGPQGLMASLQNSKDPVGDAAKGAVALVMVLRHEARGQMPINAMVPAAMTLMLRALAFEDNAKIAKIGAPELDRATHIFTNVLFAALKISPAMIKNAAVRVHQITQDPVAMDHINRKVGVVKHPLASTPTIPDRPPVSPNAV